jgi:hypothetical protein
LAARRPHHRCSWGRHGEERTASNHERRRRRRAGDGLGIGPGARPAADEVRVVVSYYSAQTGPIFEAMAEEFEGEP